MSPVVGRRRFGRRPGGRRFRGLVDAWRDGRQERTRMDYGPRVASIEAELGGDMTPGREGRWEHLDLDPTGATSDQDLDEDELAPVHPGGDGGPGVDPGVELDDAWLRASVTDVVPADVPDRDALIERAAAAARERFLTNGEVTWPEHALDLAAQTPPADGPTTHQHDQTPEQQQQKEVAVSDQHSQSRNQPIEHQGIRFPAPDSPDWDPWRRDMAQAMEQGYPEWDAAAHAEVMRDERHEVPHDQAQLEAQRNAPLQPELIPLGDGRSYLAEEHLVPLPGPEAEPEPVEPEPEVEEPEP